MQDHLISHRYSFLAIILAFLVMFASQRNAVAAEIAVLPDTANTAHPIIVIDGTIEEGDDKAFRKVALELEGAIVLFNSPGGNLVSGINIGKAIRLQEFWTAVGDYGVCASACGLAWLGGATRLADPKARIGFHAAYVEKNGEANESGAANALVGAYLNQLNMSQSAIVYLTSAPPDDMQWLPIREARSYGIDLQIVEQDAQTSSPGSSSPSSSGDMRRLNGFDIYGFDLDNMPLRNVSLDDCDASCSASSQCNAYTYNVARKACFLKSGGRTVLSNSLAVTGFKAQLESGLIKSPFTIMERTDFPGGDYRKLNLADFPDCLRACETDGSCKAFTFVKKMGVCWLKDSVSTPSVYRRAVSGVRAGN